MEYQETTTPGRSRNMAAIRGTDTRIEVAVRSALHRAGHRFRKDLVVKTPTVKARPDIVFTRKRLAVFIDGCFWHSCPVHGSRPQRNQGYWNPKLDRNRARDREQDNALAGDGWHVLRFWEHEQVTDIVASIESAVAHSV
ncbi:very short patch repair endonuclease [Aeromicrobium choanae]|uniref:T/G mismatch-specific endonuclease n=1 Tax=Aeromicrobium choanae TaxID=1736691 RepID=A0A1T4YPE0_9ACTN|nr:very short patch repair endonuclease [Aeromicrobium choanae]SKB03606.1 T/G mismatch-specific endonuclease [Aeromicrobium choanae]